MSKDIDRYSKDYINKYAKSFATTYSRFDNDFYVVKEYSSDTSHAITYIKFKVGVSDHIHWAWLSPTAWGFPAAALIVNSEEREQYRYFDEATGADLGNDKDTAAKKQYDVRIAEGQVLLDQGKFTEARDKFAQAYTDSNVSDIYNKYANCRDSINLAIDGQTLLNSGKFSEASSKFQEAYTLSNVSEVYSKFSNCRDSAKLAAEAQSLLDSGKLSEASSKFDQAYNTSTVTSIKDKLSNCRDSAKLAAEAQTLLNSGKFSEASAKFQEAWSLSNVNEVYTKYANCRDSAKLAAEAQTLLNSAKFSEAADKFQEAYTLSNIISIKTRFPNDKAEVMNKWGCALDKEGNEAVDAQIKLQKYEDARVKFEEAEKATADVSNKAIYKNNQAIALGNKASALNQLKQYDNAIIAADQALTKDPDNQYAKNQKATALNWQGCALEKEGNEAVDAQIKLQKYEDSRVKFEEAEKATTDESNKAMYKKNQAIVLGKKASSLNQLKQYDKAIVEADQALTKDSDNQYAKNQKATALNWQGCALEKEGNEAVDAQIKLQKYEDSRVKFEEAEKATTDESNKAMYKKNQAIALGNKASALNQLKQYDKAIVQADQALTKNPDNQYAKNQKATALNGWASKLKTDKNYTEAIKKYDEAIALGTSDKATFTKDKAAAINEWASKLKTDKNYTEAIKKYDEAITLNTSDKATFIKSKVEVLIDCAKDQLDKEDQETAFETALEKLNEAISLDSGNKVSYACKALALHKLGRESDAFDAIEESLKIDKDYQFAVNIQQQIFEAQSSEYPDSSADMEATEQSYSSVELLGSEFDI